MVIVRNLATNKGETTHYARNSMLNIRQEGSTKRVNNGIGLINQIKLICQKSVRVTANPRQLVKSARQGEFNWG